MDSSGKARLRRALALCCHDKNRGGIVRTGLARDKRSGVENEQHGQSYPENGKGYVKFRDAKEVHRSAINALERQDEELQSMTEHGKSTAAIRKGKAGTRNDSHRRSNAGTCTGVVRKRRERRWKGTVTIAKGKQ